MKWTSFALIKAIVEQRSHCIDSMLDAWIQKVKTARVGGLFPSIVPGIGVIPIYLVFVATIT